MKHIFTIAALICSLSGFTATITVSNLITSPAQYTDVNSAINDAQPEDTIQVYGSGISYGDITLNKPLHLIGSGFGVSVKSIFSTLTIGFQAEGSTISGFFLANYIHNISGGFHNLLIENCYIPNVSFNSACSNVIVKNCTLGSANGLGDDDSIVFSNNIFIGTITGWSNNGLGFNDGNPLSQPESLPVIVQNNVFLGDFNVSGDNLIFINNVFQLIEGQYFNAANGSNNCWGCIFQNNLTFCPSCDISTIQGMIVSDNLENQPDPFVLNAPVWQDSDFNLNASSLGNNYGTEGTDVGVFGGSFPYPAGSEYGGLLLGLPIITFFNILNPIIQENGQLQIQGTSTIPSN
jgi:hypothetical protein